MPKKLHEIKNLGAGTVFNSDEKDVNQEASTYALNIDSSSKKGELKGVKVERPVFTIGDEIELSSSVLWNNSDWSWAGYTINSDKFTVEDVSLFNEEDTAIVNVNGVKGIPEQLKLTDIRPILSPYPTNIGESDEFNVHYNIYKNNTGSLSGTTHVTTEDTVINFPKASLNWNNWGAGMAPHISLSWMGAENNNTFVITIMQPGGTNISDVRAALNGRGFTIVSPDGHKKKYRFNDNSAYNTGHTQVSEVYIQTGHCADTTAIAVEIQRALTHAKQWDDGVEQGTDTTGHGPTRLSISDINAGSTTFEFVYPNIVSLLSQGDYFSIHDNTTDIDSVKTANEIIKVESIADASVLLDGGSDPDYQFPVNQINCIRGCFGTISSSYNLSNSHRIIKQCVRIDDAMYSTTKGTFKIENWKKLSGNNLRSSSLFEFGGIDNWFHGIAGSFPEFQLEKQGKINAASKNITFSKKDKSISFSGAQNIAFNSGDKIHIFYESGGSPLNNNKTLTLLSKETNSLIVKESIVDETVTTGSFYIEGGLIKNGSLVHNHGISGNKVSSGWEEVNLKVTADSPDAGNQEQVNNYYEDSSSPACSILSSGGIAEDATNYLSSQGGAVTHYPFESNKKVVSIPSIYKRSGGTNYTTWGATIEAAATEFSSETINFEQAYATNDILKINSEYIKVLGVEKSKILLERGIYNTTAAQHTGSYVVYRNIRTSLKHTISREGLKNGQNYDLTFWAKTPTASGTHGFVSISYNGGFVDRNGDLETSNLVNDGKYYSPTADTLYAKERKWIDFNNLNKPYNDSHENSNSNLDSTFRKFQLKLNINQLSELNTDIVIEFCSGGLENSAVYLDYIQFNESTILYLNNNAERITNTFFLKDKEVRDLVIYNSHRQRLSAYRDWKAGEKINEAEITVSPFVDDTMTSTGGVISAVNRNKEAHISFGSSPNDSSPVWMGYPGQLNFGEDNRNTLYVDEDTVHTYQEPGAYSLDKICAAGEFEFQDAVLSSTGTLGDANTILTVTCTGSHGLKAGDNIVVREWADYDNSWDGKGVWYISALDGTSPSTKFVCKRHTNDFTPAIGPRAGKINFRPYYWYGIRVGSPYLYRITPDTRIKSDGSIDTAEDYLRGKILRSSNLGFAPKSITTYHNKSVNGSYGGRVYLLSDKTAANDTIEFYIADLRVPYDSFKNNPVLLNSNVMFTMPHCTYTHANREMKARSGTRAISDGQVTATMNTSKTIPYAGTPSDIIETKGTAYNYNPNAIKPTTNTPEHFDTRLWISCKGAFEEGDRFLFCAYTDETADTQANPLYGAERGPSTATTHLPDTHSDVSGGSSGYGTNYLSLPYGRISNNTNPHLLFGTHDASSQQLYGGNKRPEMEFMKSNKSSSPTWKKFNWYSKDVWGNQHVLLGDNIGWQSTSDFLGQGPNITIPRFPLMAMNDNDGDGLIDGTGLVVSNSTTLTLTGLNDDLHGPYGYEGQRVTSHCVGLLGDGNNRKWIVKAGGWGPGSNYFDGLDDEYYSAGRLWGREGMLKKIADVIFVCPDIHSGDRVAGRQAQQNGNLLYSNIQGGDMFGTKIWDGENFIGTQSQVYGNGVDDGIDGGSADNYNCFNCLISDIQSFQASSFSFDFTAGAWGTENVSKQATWAIQKNTFLPTSSEYGNSSWESHYVSEAAPGFYSKSWWQAPSSLHNFSSWNENPFLEQGDDDNFEARYSYMSDEGDLTATNIFGKVGAMYDNMPITFRNDRLNFRAGYMMRPIINGGIGTTTPCTLFGSNTIIQNVSFPDAIHYEGSRDLALTDVFFHQAQAAEGDGADPVSRTVDISNGADASVDDYTLDELKEILLGEYVYNSNKSIIGKVTDIPDLDHLTFGEGLYRDIADDDAIYVNKAFGASMGHNKYNASRIYIFKNTENNDFNMKVFNANHLLMRRSTIDSTYTGNQDGHMREPYLTGTLNGGGYVNTVTGNSTLKDAFPKYGAIKLDATGITGPADVLTDESSSYNLYINNHVSMMKGDAAGYTDGVYTNNPYRSTFIGGGFGFTNKIVGNILQIKDVSTGVYYTRYIAGSEWNEVDTKLYLLLHYPLPDSYTPHSADTFEIFSHAMGCVPDLILDHDDTGSSDANKTISGQSNVYAKASYGGLDLRRQTLWRVINSDETSVGANCTIKVWPAAHPFKVGDFINFLAADSGSDGLYNITGIGGASGNEITFVSDAGTDSNSNLQNVRMDNVEFITMDRGGSGAISEYRFEVEPYSQSIGAGEDQYDKADVIPNIFASTENKKWVKEEAEQSVTLTPSASTNQSGDYFQTSSTNTYSYNVSFTYDGYQEGPLSVSPFTSNLSATHSDITIKIKIVKFSNRLTSVNIYRKDNDNEFYRLVKAIPANKGWAHSEDGEGYEYTFRDDGSVFGSYESRTGLNEIVENIKVDYAISAEIDGYLFVGDSSHQNISDASNQIFRSKPGRYSIFDWTTDFIILGSTPTAMANFNGRLYAFDSNNIYKINPHTLQIEDTYEGVGCINNNSIVVTEKGMFFADYTGAYWHDGQKPIQISESIYQGDFDNDWNSTSPVYNTSWNNLMSSANYIYARCIFDGTLNNVLFIISSEIFNPNTNEKELKNYIWSYNLIQSRWDLWELSNGSEVGTPIKGLNGEVYIPINETIFELGKGNLNKPFTFMSKELTLGEDSIVKVYNKIKVNGISESLSSNLTNSENLLIKTSNGVLNQNEITYVDKVSDSEYKLSGTNKKGRWIKLLLENVTDTIDSLGIIYRRKTTK